MDFKIEKFKKGQETEISALIKSAYADFKYDYLGKMPQDLLVHNLKMFDEEHVLKKASNSEMFVCLEYRQKIIGVACLEKDEIHTCYTSGDFQNRGVGKKLLAHIEKLAKERGIKKLFLYSNLYAEKFYSSCGFEPVRNSVYDFYGYQVDVVYMEKSIP